MVAEVAVLMRAIADEETGDAGADGHSTTSTECVAWRRRPAPPPPPPRRPLVVRRLAPLDARQDAQLTVRWAPPSAPRSVFKLTKQYCEQFGGNTSAEALTQIRTLLHDSKLEEFELASIANLNPVNAEEAKALVPSVKFQTPARESADQILSDDQLKAMLDEMAEYRMAGM